MSFGFRKFLSGINLIPKASATGTDKGDLEVISGSGKISYHNGTSSSPVLTEAHTATVTNKSIDADSNTITNIENADIKAGAAIDATKIADGSVSNIEYQYLDGVSSSIQTQLNGKQASGNYITALTGDVTASGPGSVASTVALVGGKSAAAVATSVDDTLAATNANTASTIVKRDASGNFSAGDITADLIGNADSATVANNVSGVVAIANGGTGQTAANAAFNALSPMTTGGDLIYGGASGAATRLANGTAGQVLTSNGGTTAPSWQSVTGSVPPLITVYNTNGASGTHTFTGTPTYVKIRMVGAGGGGAGSGTGGWGTPGNGTSTTINTTYIVAGGGQGSPTGGYGGGVGGSVTFTPSSGLSGFAVAGGSGAQSGAPNGTNTVIAGGAGASSPFGGAGGGGLVTAVAFGSGGAGATSGGTTTNAPGGGGGAGGYVEAFISGTALSALSGSFSYTIGSLGSGGAAGTSGSAGGDGNPGAMIIEEYY